MQADVDLKGGPVVVGFAQAATNRALERDAVADLPLEADVEGAQVRLARRLGALRIDFAEQRGLVVDLVALREAREPEIGATLGHTLEVRVAHEIEADIGHGG